MQEVKNFKSLKYWNLLAFTEVFLSINIIKILQPARHLKLATRGRHEQYPAKFQNFGYNLNYADPLVATISFKCRCLLWNSCTCRLRILNLGKFRKVLKLTYFGLNFYFNRCKKNDDHSLKDGLQFISFEVLSLSKFSNMMYYL